MGHLTTYKISKGDWLFTSDCGNIQFNVYKDESVEGIKKWIVEPVGKTTKNIYNKFPGTEKKLFYSFLETIQFTDNILFCYEFRNHHFNPFNIFK